MVADGETDDTQRSADTRPKPFVFVLMPFEKAFDDIYRLGIKQACERAGAYAERVDEQVFEGRIVERIYNQIAKADVIVADMTGRNPNVFFEAGYAYALGKCVILLTQRVEDIPFDLKDYPHIEYANQIAGKLIPEVERRVRWFIEHRGSQEIVGRENLKVSMDGRALCDNPTFDFATAEPSLGGMRFKFDFHNDDTTTIRTETVQLALVCPASIRMCRGRGFETEPIWRDFNVVSIGKATKAFLSQHSLSILPGGWSAIDIAASCATSEPILKGTEVHFSLRVLSNIASRDLPFRIRIVGDSAGS